MERAHGIDISKWQVSFDPTVNPDDIHFVVMRAGYGIFPDPIFDKLHDSIQPIEVRGIYHYFRSEWDWKSQADFFLTLVENKGFHFYALDIETGDNVRSRTFAQGAEQWLKYVAEKSGKPVILYTNPAVYNGWLKPYGNWMTQYPLWLAQYWLQPDRNKKPGLPTGVTDWKIWQYSADGNFKGKEYGVGSRHIDLDVFNGTVEELHQWVGLDTAAVTTPAATPPTEEETVAVSGEIDYDLLAQKLAPLVAPIVARMVPKLSGGPSTGRPATSGGVAFGLPMAEEEEEPALVDEINGIGPAYKETLAENGIMNVHSLAYLGAEALADILDTSHERAQEFIDQAFELLGPGG